MDKLGVKSLDVFLFLGGVTSSFGSKAIDFVSLIGVTPECDVTLCVFDPTSSVSALDVWVVAVVAPCVCLCCDGYRTMSEDARGKAALLSFLPRVANLGNRTTISWLTTFSDAQRRCAVNIEQGSMRSVRLVRTLVLAPRVRSAPFEEWVCVWGRGEW